MPVFKSVSQTVSIPSVDLFSFVLGDVGTSRSTAMIDNKPALVCGVSGRALSYSRLRSLSLQWASALKEEFRFNAGHVVAVFAPNEVDYAVVVLGSLAAGGVLTTPAPTLDAESLASQLRDSRAKILVTTPLLLATARKAAELAETPDTHIVVFGTRRNDGVARCLWGLLRGRVEAKPWDCNSAFLAEKVAFLVYTRGTTFGKSKVCEMTHRNLIANVLQMNEVLKDNFLECDTVLAALPFSQMFGLSHLLHEGLYQRTTLIVHPTFNLETCLRLIQRYRITFLPCFPPTVNALARDRLVDFYNLACLRRVLVVASPLNADAASTLKTRLHGQVRITQTYGITETGFACVGNFITNERGSVGPLLPNTTARVVDVESGRELGADEHGEILLRGANIMKGYLNNPDLNSTVFDKLGFMRTGIHVIDSHHAIMLPEASIHFPSPATGDYGYATKDGHLFILGRLADGTRDNSSDGPVTVEKPIADDGLSIKQVQQHKEEIRSQSFIKKMSTQCHASTTSTKKPLQLNGKGSEYLPTNTFDNENTFDRLNPVIQNLILRTQSSKRPFKFIPYSEFIDVEEVARGGYGTVYSATCQAELGFELRVKERKVALKKLTTRSDDAFLQEMQSHCKMCSKGIFNNIVSLWGITMKPDTGELMMVMQWCSGGDLRQELHLELSKSDVYDRIRDIVYGLHGIHAIGMYHGDLHAGNILLDGNWARICDLGHCKAAKEHDNGEKKVTGVPLYIAPEVLRGGQYTMAADIYSLGMIMWTLLSRKQPFADRPHDVPLITEICEGLRPDIPSYVPSWLANLICRCWDAEPNRRPTTADIKPLADEMIICDNRQLPNIQVEQTTPHALAVFISQTFPITKVSPELCNSTGASLLVRSFRPSEIAPIQLVIDPTKQQI